VEALLTNPLCLKMIALACLSLAAALSLAGLRQSKDDQ
jgi:hypothetical protein